MKDEIPDKCRGCRSILTRCTLRYNFKLKEKEHVCPCIQCLIKGICKIQCYEHGEFMEAYFQYIIHNPVTYIERHVKDDLPTDSVMVHRCKDRHIGYSVSDDYERLNVKYTNPLTVIVGNQK